MLNNTNSRRLIAPNNEHGPTKERQAGSGAQLGTAQAHGTAHTMSTPTSQMTHLLMAGILIIDIYILTAYRYSWVQMTHTDS